MKNPDHYTREEIEVAILRLQDAIDNPDGLNRQVWREQGIDGFLVHLPNQNWDVDAYGKPLPTRHS